MKKFSTLFLIMAIFFTLFGCNNKNSTRSEAEDVAKNFLEALIVGDSIEMIHYMPYNSSKSSAYYAGKGVISYDEISFTDNGEVDCVYSYYLRKGSSAEIDAIYRDSFDSYVKYAKQKVEENGDRYKIIKDELDCFSYEDTSGVIKSYTCVYEVQYIDYLGDKKTAKVTLEIREKKPNSNEFEIVSEKGL